MRKSEREIKEFKDIIAVLDACQTIRLGLFDEKYPYVVPLSFGYETVGEQLFLYFHCAKEGKKIDLLAKNPAVCVEADMFDGYIKTERGVTADYKSVIGFGCAEQVFGEEAMHGIECLLAHCGIEGYSPRDCVLTQLVAVYKVRIETITGKKRF